MSKIKKEKSLAGRPRKEIDEELLYELAMIGCTVKEMASIFKCHQDTLYANFSEIIEMGRDEGKSSLRRMQFKKAKEGNVPMLIWLGKQLLGQSDKNVEIQASTDLNSLITLTYNGKKPLSDEQSGVIDISPEVKQQIGEQLRKEWDAKKKTKSDRDFDECHSIEDGDIPRTGKDSFFAGIKEEPEDF